MTPDQQFILAIIAQLAGLVIAVATLMSKVGAVQSKLDEVHVQVNSRMDQLLALTAKSSRTEGANAEAARSHTERATDQLSQS